MSDSIDSPILVDTTYVAAYLGVTEATVDRMLRDKRLPGIKLGHRWYIRKDRLEEVLDPGPWRKSTDSGA